GDPRARRRAAHMLTLISRHPIRSSTICSHLEGPHPQPLLTTLPTWMPMIRHLRLRRIQSLAGAAEPFAAGDVGRGAMC
ncbi:hypothetical protein PIB30_109502, partial [Stylosanthes scabra]|nr:hypothetical protein [Stylosanthes scabra]